MKKQLSRQLLFHSFHMLKAINICGEFFVNGLDDLCVIKESEAKIKRKLRTKKLGQYDSQRVTRLRCLKDAVQTEITKCDKSKYYSKLAGEFANMKDFDTLRMTKDFAAAFPEVPKQSIHEFVEYLIYLHYIR